MINQIVKSTLVTLVFLLTVQFSYAQKNACQPSFNEIRVSGNIEVELIPGSRSVLEFKSNKNEAEWAVEAGKLMIRHLQKSDELVKVKIVYNELTKLVAAGGAKFNSGQPMNENDLELLLLNNSQGDLSLESQHVDVRLFGESQLKLTGEAESISYRVVSDSQLLAETLNCENVRGVTEKNGIANVNGRLMMEIDGNKKLRPYTGSSSL